MFTRTKDTRNKIQHDLNAAAYANNYVFTTPGNGAAPKYIENVEIRLQKWGGNLRTHPIDIDSNLRGIGHHLGRDDVASDDYTKHAVRSSQKTYSTGKIAALATKLENPLDRKEKIILS